MDKSSKSLAKIGKIAQETISAVYTDTTIDNAVERSGAIANNFDSDKISKEVNLQIALSKQLGLVRTRLFRK